MREARIPVDAAHAFCLDLLEQLGVTGDEAKACVDSMIDASLRGVDSHGIVLLATYAERIRSGQIRPGRQPFLRREAWGTALVDGQHGLGPYLARATVEVAADKARRFGVGAVSLRDGNYVGALAGYVEAPARAGLLALAVANATPRVAPHGGREGLHGTNPLAWAAPVEAGEPMVFDAATGYAAAKLTQAADEGRPAPAGVALDADGRPTVDAAAAAAGALLPVGGVLGYGMGLLIDLLCGGLACAPSGRGVPPVSQLDGPYGCSFFCLVLEPAFFGGRTALSRAAQGLAAAARNTAPAAGVDKVRAPGDRARRVRCERLAKGILVSDRRWQALLDRLRACGLETGRWAYDRW